MFDSDQMLPGRLGENFLVYLVSSTFLMTLSIHP